MNAFGFQCAVSDPLFEFAVNYAVSMIIAIIQIRHGYEVIAAVILAQCCFADQAGFDGADGNLLSHLGSIAEFGVVVHFDGDGSVRILVCQLGKFQGGSLSGLAVRIEVAQTNGCRGIGFISHDCLCAAKEHGSGHSQ